MQNERGGKKFQEREKDGAAKMRVSGENLTQSFANGRQRGCVKCVEMFRNRWSAGDAFSHTLESRNVRG